MTENDLETDEALELDFRLFGSCFWQFKDGKKVRIDPLDVEFDENVRKQLMGKLSDVQITERVLACCAWLKGEPRPPATYSRAEIAEALEELLDRRDKWEMLHDIHCDRAGPCDIDDPELQSSSLSASAKP